MKRGFLKATRVALFAVCLAGIGLAFAPAPCAAQAGKPNSTQTTGMPEVQHEMTYDIVNFILLVIILAYLYRKHGSVFFRQRAESIRKDLDEGRKALEASQAQLAVAEQKLAKLEEEIEALRKRTEAEMSAEQERARKETAAEADRILEHTRGQIQAATNAAKLELKDYIVDEALRQARSNIRERLDPVSRRQLVDSFLDDLSTKMSKN